jgi:hypothetical protein
MTLPKGPGQGLAYFSRGMAAGGCSQRSQRLRQADIRVVVQRIYFVHFWQLNFVFNMARARCKREATVPGEHSRMAAESA